MYEISKRMEISGSHQLELPYDSKCTNLHGHNWIVTVHVRGETLNPEGMLTDFTIIKSKVSDVLDHRHLNDVVPFNPTAENLAKWIHDQIPGCFRVDVQETEGNVASYYD